MRDDPSIPMDIGWFRVSFARGILRIESPSTTTLELSATQTRKLLILLYRWLDVIDQAYEQEKKGH